MEGWQDGGGARANPQGHRHRHRCLPSPPLASPHAKLPNCYRPVPPSSVPPLPPSLLPLVLAFLFLFILFVLLFDFPKLESLWLQRKEPCCPGTGRMGAGRGMAAPHGMSLSENSAPRGHRPAWWWPYDAATTVTLGGGRRRTPCPPHTKWVPAVAPRAPKIHRAVTKCCRSQRAGGGTRFAFGVGNPEGVDAGARRAARGPRRTGRCRPFHAPAAAG